MATTTTTNSMLIVKMIYGTEIRRYTANVATLNVAAVAKRAVEAFGLATKKFKMSYVDDEGDKITLSSDEELSEAVGLALSGTPAVLRLTLNTDGAESKPAAPTDPELSAFVETIANQLPEALRNILPHVELDLPATLAANLGGDTYVHPHAPTATVGVHEGVTCDKSGVCPIVGNRYHLFGHNYDLCEAEFEKLAENEKALYEKIPPPSAETVKAAQGFHPGVSCDRSGMVPIVGTRYKLRGHNYDLCEAEFNKLDATEKANYDAIAPPMAGGPWRGHCRGGWGRGWGGAFGKGMGGKGMGGKGMGMGGMGMAMGGMGMAMGGMGMGGKGMGGKGCGKGGGMGGDFTKLSARFISDVAVFDGTQVTPGTTFVKIWKLKNSGEVAWPAGTRMLFVGGDQMTSEMSVPIGRDSPVMPGEEVDVAVEMTAPTDLGRYLGYWRLTGPHCRRKWGQRVWCHVQVVDPSQPAGAVDVEGAVAEFEKMKSKLPAEEGEEGGEELTSSPMAIEKSADGKSADDKSADGKSADDKSADGKSADGKSADEDAVLVTDKMVVEAQPSADKATLTPPPATPPPAPLLTGAALVKASLKAMGFIDDTMIEAAIAKHGEDLDACATALAAASEWDSLLDDLLEMGFEDRELNKTLMLKNNGNIKRTVKDLVEA